MYRHDGLARLWTMSKWSHFRASIQIATSELGSLPPNPRANQETFHSLSLPCISCQKEYHDPDARIEMTEKVSGYDLAVAAYSTLIVTSKPAYSTFLLVWC